MLDTTKHLVVTVDDALALLEHYPGEVFSPDKFSVVDLRRDELESYQVPTTAHITKICFLHICFGQFPDTDLSKFDLIVVVDDELIKEDSNLYLEQLANKLNNKQIIIITSGYRQSVSLDRNRVYVYPFFLLNIARFNCFKEVNSLAHYQKTFDALLGMSKLHRQFIFDNLVSSRLTEQCYINLTSNRFVDDSLYTIYRSPELAELESDEYMQFQTSDVFDSYAHRPGEPRTSQYIPWNIYKNSLYSIVAESNYSEHYFYSEKTAKCLFARRLFVFFGAPGQLRDLRKLGFMTFDSVIDESYDSIDNNVERFKQAFQQVLALSRTDHTKVYQMCEKIWTHNQQHLSNRDFFLNPLRNWLKNHVPELV